MSQAVANIDTLSSIPSEVLQDSGPYGRVYDLQLKLAHAQRHLEIVRENLYERIARDERAAQSMGRIGSLTPAHERVERDPDVISATAEVKLLTAQVQDAQAEIGGIVFLPAADNVPEIEKRLTSLNRKAGKIGTEPITFQLSDERLLLNYAYSEDPETHRAHRADFEHVFAVLKGTTPQIPGFEFLATITTTEHGNVVKRIPPFAYGIRHNLAVDAVDSEGKPLKSAAQEELEAIDLTRFHSTGDICEHCHKERRRNDLYVVFNAQTGETKQVGRTCLRDFTGLNDPERVLKVLEQVWELVRYAGSSRGVTPAMRTEDFLTHCAAMMRTGDGGYFKGMGYEAMHNYYDKLYDRRDKQTNAPLWVEPTDFDHQSAQRMLQWVKTWEETGEFATNVKIALSDTVMNHKLVGIGGAVFIAREKWEQGASRRQEQAERQAAQVTKQHIGTVGQREVFTLTIKSIKWIADRYGYGDDATKPLIIMQDADGNDVKWFASNLPYIDGKTPVMVDGTYEVRGTVKYHDEDERYGKSTVITRCKFEKIINEPQEDNG